MLANHGTGEPDKGWDVYDALRFGKDTPSHALRGMLAWAALTKESQPWRMSLCVSRKQVILNVTIPITRNLHLLATSATNKDCENVHHWTYMGKSVPRHIFVHHSGTPKDRRSGTAKDCGVGTGSIIPPSLHPASRSRFRTPNNDRVCFDNPAHGTSPS